MTVIWRTVRNQLVDKVLVIQKDPIDCGLIEVRIPADICENNQHGYEQLWFESGRDLLSPRAFQDAVLHRCGQWFCLPAYTPKTEHRVWMEFLQAVPTTLPVARFSTAVWRDGGAGGLDAEAYCTTDSGVKRYTSAVSGRDFMNYFALQQAFLDDCGVLFIEQDVTASDDPKAAWRSKVEHQFVRVGRA